MKIKGALSLPHHSMIIFTPKKRKPHGLSPFGMETDELEEDLSHARRASDYQ